ncbi:MAG: phenylacetate--CoA ligase [Coriobacteriia bacterium]|nr:phenylacetate--CoA ligase [Coriobacteriia bacterium]
MSHQYNPSVESMPAAQLQALQQDQLRQLVPHLYQAVPVYKHKFDQAGIDPFALQSLADLAQLPFTTKDDLRAAYPYAMFSAPTRDIVRVHASSGTTGSISVVGYTTKDIANWAECVARAIVAAGGTADDFLHVAYGYGLFTGGLGLHYGAELMGACVIPISGGNTKRQIQFLRDLMSTGGLACTPSYALLLAEEAAAQGVDLAALPLRFGIFGAEPWSENMRSQIEAQLGIDAYDIYGLSEIMGPGVAFECQAKDGLHINEDQFYVEVVDRETGECVQDGQYGELVFTTLAKQGSALLRYNTHDISRIVPGVCSCGRTHKRIERITGRSDDMIIVRGVNVYPSQIEQVLLGFTDRLAPQYQVVLTREAAMDAMEVRVELSPNFDFDEISALERLSIEVRTAIASVLSVSVKLSIVEPYSIARTEGKAVRLVDRRTAE